MFRNNTNKAVKRSLRAAAIGNALEWFDWTLYGIFSTYLAVNLFEKKDPHSALLSALAVFAGGFLARPIGGWVFGRLGDKIGRKKILIMTMIVLALSSVAMALIPTYESIGVTASALLLVCRLLQGLAHGGEAGISFTYITEIAPASRRGLWSSSVYISVVIGVMSATALAAWLSTILTSGAMSAYGWRIGFGIGGLLGIYALFLRRSTVETDAFINASHDSGRENIKLSRAQLLRCGASLLMICAAANVTYYTWFNFAPSIAIAKGMNASAAYTASLVAQGLCLIWLPVFGMLSDRLGRKLAVKVWAALIIILAYPISLSITGSVWLFFLSQVVALITWSIISSIYPAILSEQVPTHVRARGVGLVPSVSVAIFGGTAPYLTAYTSGTQYEPYYIAYVMILGLIAFAGGFFIRETAQVELVEIDAYFYRDINISCSSSSDFHNEKQLHSSRTVS